MLNTNLAPTTILQDKVAVLEGLTGVIKIAELPQALAVPAASPVNSVKELVALAKTSRLSTRPRATARWAASAWKC